MRQSGRSTLASAIGNQKFGSDNCQKERCREYRGWAADLAVAFAKAEARAEPVPQIQAKRHRNQAEQDKLPVRGTVAKQVPGVPCAYETTDAYVDPVGYEAETGKEPAEVQSGRAADSGGQKNQNKQRGADNRPRPRHEQRMRVAAKVGSRNHERMQNYPCDIAAADPSPEDMAKLVDDLHREPRETQERGYQGKLVNSSHVFAWPSSRRATRGYGGNGARCS